MMIETRQFPGAALLLSLVVCGCSDEGDIDRKPVYPVTGKVMMHGVPLADAAVSFAPREGQPTAAGRTNAAGEFTLTTYEFGDGAAAGNYAVLVTKAIAAAAAGPDAGHVADATSSDPTGGHNAEAASGGEAVDMVPAKYGDFQETPLSATVTAAGENRFDLTVE
jgi:hypothetical protein